MLGAALDVTDLEAPACRAQAVEDEKRPDYSSCIRGYSLEETWNRVFKICADNLEAYVKGQELKRRVDLRAGY